LNQVTFTPSTTNLKISLSGPEQKDFSYRYVFEMLDNHGNQFDIINSGAISAKGMDNGFFITIFNEYFEPVSGKLPQSISIQPYLLHHTVETLELPLDQNLPI
jgi:hypothetical protein